MARRRVGPVAAASATPDVVHPEAAGIDVGAGALYVAVRPDRADPPIRRFATFTADLEALAVWLRHCRVATVAMESTGVYWIPLFQVLAARGFDVVLVNARHVKHVPGRKSDVTDCEWLRYLHSVGLLKGSFRPTDPVCAIRSLLRHRDSLVKSASRAVLHMQKALDQMNIQIHRVLSKLTGVSGLRLVDAILAGQRDPAQLLPLVHKSVKATAEELTKALQGDWRAEHLFTLGQARRTYAHYQELIAECDVQIAQRMEAFDPTPAAPPPDDGADPPAPPSADAAPPGPPEDRDARLAQLFGTDLTRLPGLGTDTVQLLFSELGPDLSSHFATAAQFCCWLGLCPHNEVSGDKQLRSRTLPGSRRVAQGLRMAAQSLYANRSPLGVHFQRLCRRLGKPKAITAMAHKLARIIYHLVTHRVPYDEGTFTHYEIQRRVRRQRHLHEEARALGFQLLPLAATEGVS